MFKEKNGENLWEKINIEKFSENTVKSLIGEEYNELSKKLERIIKDSK